MGAIASALAGEIYDLDVLVASAEDAEQAVSRLAMAYVESRVRALGNLELMAGADADNVY